MKTSWWKLALFAAAVPVLITVAAWAERESRAKEARRRVARLAEDDWCTCNETHACEGHRG